MNDNTRQALEQAYKRNSSSSGAHQRKIVQVHRKKFWAKNKFTTIIPIRPNVSIWMVEKENFEAGVQSGTSLLICFYFSHQFSTRRNSVEKNKNISFLLSREKYSFLLEYNTSTNMD
jgi:hypothetical protein